MRIATRMSHGNPVYLVDVFAQQVYSGNPLAVVVCRQPASASAMQRFAAEMNFSETTFVAASADADGGFATRVFTPVREIAFTGHPILGTAWVIRHKLLPELRDRVCLNLGAGQIAVDFETDSAGAERCWFTAPQISAGAIIEASRLAPAIGLQEQDIDRQTPIRVYGAGTSAIIVPLRKRGALGRSRLDLQAFADLAADGHPPLVYLFFRDTHDSATDIAARFFFEAGEVREDPATGNGAAFLGAYLRDHRLDSLGPMQLRIEQGLELGRPSLIHLQIEADRLRVGGTVVATLSGELDRPLDGD